MCTASRTCAPPAARTPCCTTRTRRSRSAAGKTLREGEDVALIGAGVTVHTCLQAAERLAEKGVQARVIDLYSVKPVDAEGLVTAAEASGGRLVVVEDHHVEGGVGSAVLEALADEGARPRVRLLGVRGLPGSGTAQELMDAAGIGVDDVVRAAIGLVEGES
ncbi:transketolase C-terminal domain-containing protein [Microbacterium elymi]|uniref:Transketolase C-terminal domain-containing protein n=1 Tax=Microbacterium elymi TaxID=2909587 RepID=A0ABY5NMX8_9MICO|nr:transketolase C-terminal domain-containing protein [Microbacterium elymi]UUT36512.1 hypothetical protein L2X98_20725 [Microbacterium elymi]